MSTVLTDLVRQMDAESGPSVELFQQSWDALRGLLVAEMKRRSNWVTPPRFLGVVGHPSWLGAGVGADALDELTAECFEFVFVRRLSGLREQARRKPNVDGLVALAIRHFLLEAQQRNDPLGFRIFEVLRRVARQGLEEERLILVAGDPRVRNDSKLAYHGWDVDNAVELSSEEALSTLADHWVQDHLERLMSAAYGDLKRLCDDLEKELVSFLRLGPGVIRFGDLASMLKDRGRSAWASRYCGPTGGRSEPAVPLFEDSADFTLQVTCVTRRIEDFKGRAKTRLYLARLWHFLRAFAGDSDVDTSRFLASGLEWQDDDDLPTYRRLAKIVQVPRERIPGLLQTLGELWSKCRTETAAQLSPNTMPSSSPPSPGSENSAKARVFNALRQVAKSSSATAESDGLPPRVWTSELQAGDIYAFPATGTDGVRWLKADLDDGAVLIPVDDCPLWSADDLVVEVPGFTGDQVLRPQFAIHRPKLKPHPRFPVYRLASLSGLQRQRVESELKQVLQRIRLAETVPAPPPRYDGRVEVDPSLPCYVDWLRDGPEQARSQLLAWTEDQEATPGAPAAAPEAPSSGSTAASPRSTGLTRSWAWPALAAILATVVLGLTWHLGVLEDSLEELSAPIGNVPYDEVDFQLIPRGPRSLNLPEGAEHIQIGFEVPPIESLEGYRIVLTDGDGRRLKTLKGQPLGGPVTWLFRLDTLPDLPWAFGLQVPQNDEWHTVDQVVIESWVRDQDP